MRKLIGGVNVTTGEITHKINEIVAWINEQEAVEKVLKSEEQYPDFDKWDREAIETNVWLHTNPETTRDSFLVVAPEDFHIKHDGKIKIHFTWDEAMEYEEEVLKPHGWRLPTTKEWAMLCATYIGDDGKNDTARFEKELNFAKSGYVGVAGGVVGTNLEGRWWSSTATSASAANYLRESSGYFLPQSNNSKRHGFCVRAVKEGV